jgi:cytochrome P450
VTAIATSTAHDDAPDLPQLPFPREGVLRISPLYERLRTAGPVTRVRTPAGDVAWLVTRYEEAKALFADRRLGRSHPRPAEAARVSDAGVMAGPSGDHEHEDDDHASMRRLLTPAFSAKRMRRLHDGSPSWPRPSSTTSWPRTTAGRTRWTCTPGSRCRCRSS